ncbi:MAG: transcription elongation factor GreA [Pseudomonadota bacterium]
MNKVPLTAAGYRGLQEELKQLKSVERPAVIEAIASAREYGDLSENAEYHAAREKQSFIEGRIGELEDKISRAEVIDPATMGGDIVLFGATVNVAEGDDEAETTYQIVGEIEADISKGRLSVSAPLARSLIGKTVGDVFELQTPGGTKEYEITSVKFE